MMSKRRYRKKRVSESDEEEELGEEEEEGSGGKGREEETENDVGKILAETKELQKFRRRPGGVSAGGLAFGQKFAEEEKLVPVDPFKLKSGGLVDMKDIAPADLEKSEDDLLQKLKSTFSAETKLKDDETHMMQYIEQEMSKKRKLSEEESTISGYDAKIKALYQLPDHLNVQSKSKKTEEMLSNQMLSGIPEVDLGVEAKFKNIEETERAKQQLIEEQMKKKEEKLSLVPKNMAANFTLQSLRFYKGHRQQPEKQSKPAPEEKKEVYIPVVGEGEPELKVANTSDGHKRKIDQSQLATDDYCYDKYRKKTRHY